MPNDRVFGENSLRGLEKPVFRVIVSPWLRTADTMGGSLMMHKWLFTMMCCISAVLTAAFATCAEPVWETRFAGDRNVLLRDGGRVGFRECVREELRRHPSSRAEDVLKLCFQGARGPWHILADPEAARKYFDAEFAAVSPRPDQPLYEIISPDFMRVNLGAWKAANLPPAWLFRMFAASAREFSDADAVLKEYLAVAESELDGARRARFAELRKTATAAPHHSAAYRAAEAPSYRIVSTRFLNALAVLRRAAALPEQGVRVIAVDGRAASGKTTLARQLALILNADTVHMDDFFLPVELRTEKRYAEPGGNVHYERFIAEVLPRLKDGRPFAYRRFDCSMMAYGDNAEIGGESWRIVEGAYSLHPKFGNYADLKVFYDIDPAEQMRRIRRRNGERGARMFKERWIPLEELYIDKCAPRDRADLVIGGNGQSRR